MSKTSLLSRLSHQQPWIHASLVSYCFTLCGCIDTECNMLNDGQNVTLVVLLHFRYEAEFQKTYLDKMRCKVWTIHTFSSLYTLLSTHTVHIYLFCLCCKLYGYFGLCFSPAAWVGSEAATWRQVSCQLFTITFPAGADVRTVSSSAFDCKYRIDFCCICTQWHCWVIFGHHAQNRWGKTLFFFQISFDLIIPCIYVLTLGCDFTNGFLCLAEMKIANSKDR